MDVKEAVEIVKVIVKEIAMPEEDAEALRTLISAVESKPSVDVREIKKIILGCACGEGHETVLFEDDIERCAVAIHAKMGGEK